MVQIDGVMDPYAVLDVPVGASAAQVRRAYRRLARRWHPDLNRDPAAAAHFKRVQLAYEQLTRPEGAALNGQWQQAGPADDPDDPFLRFFAAVRRFARQPTDQKGENDV